MREHAIRTEVGRTGFGVVVEIHVVRDGDNVEHGVALGLQAVPIQLGHQWGSRRLQSFAAAFAIGTFRFATEVRDAVVFAVGCDGAFGGFPAAAATAARIATAAGAARAAATAARRGPFGRGFVAATYEVERDETDGCSNQPSFSDFHVKHSSRAAHGAVIGSFFQPWIV